MILKAIIAFLIGLHILPSLPAKILTLPTPSPSPQNLQPLQTNVSIPDEVYADLALQHELNHVSVYYFDENAKNTVTINANKNWDPASTIKLYVAMYAFDQVAAGNISLDSQVIVEDKNVAPSQAFPNGYPLLRAGDTVSVYELLDRMITQSGNSSYNTLLDLLDRVKITKYVHDLGLVNSSVGAKLNLDDEQEAIDSLSPGFGSNTTNADDYARAFILINGKRLPGSANLFDMLSRQKFNSMIPALLPKDVTVAHKTGELDPYYHDGGIVSDTKRRYVLSIFSDMGDPEVVAHISDLIYTTDVNLVGNSENKTTTSEAPLPPIDPLVAAGEPLTLPNVLAANTANIKLPKITASDLGIKATDISGALDTKQLPVVIIPSDSPFHFLINLGEKIRVATNPVPELRTKLETENLKLNLAEANDLIKKGKPTEANKILQTIDADLTKIAKEASVTNNKTLQTSINQVSETRFAILGNEVKKTTTEEEKINIIKEVAAQAKNTAENVKPFIPVTASTNSLSQIPVIGKVVASSPTSITVQTADGKEVTTSVETQVKTRDSGQDEVKVQNPGQIKVGSTVAVASNFILTNVGASLSNSTPVTVLKVNLDTNTLVIASGSGIPVQVDLTNQTVIKGLDTTVSLSQLKPGDIVVVHGESMPNSATPSSSITTSPTPTSTSSPVVTPVASTTGSNNSSTIPNATAMPTLKTTNPLSTSAPLKQAGSSPLPSSTSLPKPVATPPTVIKGSLIQVVQQQKTQPSSKPVATPKPVSIPAPATTIPPTLIPKKN